MREHNVILEAWKELSPAAGSNRPYMLEEPLRRGSRDGVVMMGVVKLISRKPSITNEGPCRSMMGTGSWAIINAIFAIMSRETPV